jgi:hypothetical protein
MAFTPGRHRPARGRLGALIAGMVFLVLGVVFGLVVPAAFFERYATFPEARGRVVEMRAETASGGVSYRPVVAFEAANGEPYRFTSSTSSSPPSHTAGDIVTVRYNPADPIDAVIFDDIALLALIFRILGGAFGAIGLILLGVVMIGTLVEGTAPDLLPAFEWWTGVGCGLAGAAVFAIPATCALPLLYLAYLRRPNMLFRADADPAAQLAIGTIFSVIGFVVCVALVFAIRILLRRRQQHSSAYEQASEPPEYG